MEANTHSPTRLDGDRELLELAAKAAGIELEWDARGAYEPLAGISGNSRTWNPLTDDGDALRLAQALCMHVECTKGYQHVSVYGRGFTLTEPDFNHEVNPAYWTDDERRAATRRAIVRAAAEIGVSA